MGNYEPTTFFILENGELGTWWVGKTKMELDAMDFPTRRSVSQSELLIKLEKKFETHHMYTRPSLDIRFLNNDGIVCYGIERWLSQLDNKIRKNPQMYEELRKLLTAGWTNDDLTMNSTLHVLHIWNPNKLTNINDLYSDLKRNWGVGGEGQLRSFHKLNNCLNERISKPNDVYLYQKGRAKLLREMKKTGKRPKQSTLEKYKITFEEILYIKEMPEEKLVMEEPRGIIYKISSPSGKVYVGQTVRSFEKRMQEHRQETSCCTSIKRAIDKYGDQMKYEIIEGNVPHEQLDEREIYWIKELNSLAPSGYNLTTGGQFSKEYSQELKDKMRDIKNTQKVEKDGYMGFVSKIGNFFYPHVRQCGKKIRISYGGFQTEEEVIEVLKEYTKDPDNFTPVNNGIRNKVGSVCKSRGKWSAGYKQKHLGTYDTEEEAWEALEKYLKDPENFPSFKRNVGNISHSRNRWQLKYKHKHLGSYDTQQEAQEALERYIKNPENFIKPEVRRRHGSVAKYHNRWKVSHKGIFLGGYDTKEQAQEALERYIEDPENFVKPETKIGSVFFEKGKWRLIHKSKHIGYYPTKEKAEEVREIYLRDPENFVKSDHIPKKIIGSISKRGNRWRLRTKFKQIGTYATKEEAEKVRQALQSSL